MENNKRQFIMMFGKKKPEEFECQLDELQADTAYYFLGVMIIEDSEIISNRYFGKKLVVDKRSKMEIDWDAFWSQISHYNGKMVSYTLNSEKYDEDYLKMSKYIYFAVPSLVEHYLGSEKDVLIALTQIGRKINNLVRELNNSEPVLSVATCPGIYSTFSCLSDDELNQLLAPSPNHNFSSYGSEGLEMFENLRF